MAMIGAGCLSPMAALLTKGAPAVQETAARILLEFVTVRCGSILPCHAANIARRE